MILGKMQTWYNTGGLTLLIDGEDEPTQKKYKYLASYVPSAGDRVLIEEIGDTYVVLGKVISNYSNSGNSKFMKNYFDGFSDIRLGSRWGNLYMYVGNVEYELETK